MDKVSFVISLKNNDNKTIYWNKYQIRDTKKDEWVKNNCSFRFNEVEKGKGYKLKVYVLNKDKKEFCRGTFRSVGDMKAVMKASDSFS